MTIEEINIEMQIVDIKMQQEEDQAKRADLTKQKQILGLRLEIERIKKRIGQLGPS